MKKPWYIYAISFWSIWIVWSLGSIVSKNVVGYFNIDNTFTLVLMCGFALITMALINGLFVNSRTTYTTYGFYSLFISVVCLIVGASSIFLYPINTAFYFVVSAGLCFVPSALTVYVCLYKKPYISNT